jgi:hypothetical protein
MLITTVADASVTAIITVYVCMLIDLGTEIAPGLSFAFETGDDDAMLKPPRRAVVPQDVVIEEQEVPDMEKNTHIEVRTHTCAFVSSHAP